MEMVVVVAVVVVVVVVIVVMLAVKRRNGGGRRYGESLGVTRVPGFSSPDPVHFAHVTVHSVLTLLS
jgi:preprotein translocase subunit SecG